MKFLFQYFTSNHEKETSPESEAVPDEQFFELLLNLAQKTFSEESK